jgi:L-threonine kinase
MRCSVPAARPASSGYASCHGSFGELLQGALPDLGPFLVTLPIELHARAHFVARDSSRELRVHPESSWKSRRLAEALLRRHELPLRGELMLDSEIPRGKGLASSTADLVATYRAVASCHDLPHDMDVLAELLRDIEPSDGVMHEGVVVYRHRSARLLERLGPVPPFTLIAIDEGGEVETLAHNDRDPDYSSRELDEFADLLMRLRHAFDRVDVAAIGAVATRSAEINQRVLPKQWLSSMIDVAAAVDAVGVVAAHSGTCLALLIDARRAGHDDDARSASERLVALGLQPMILRTFRTHVLPAPAHA